MTDDQTGPTRILTADGTHLGVRQIDGDGTLVVALHGFTGDGSTMVDLVEKCRGARPALLVDLVGHGVSDSPEHPETYSMASVVDQVLSLIGPREPGSTHLIGYSMGGRVALSMAARAPWYFASVTSISSTPGIDEPTDRARRYDQDQQLADRVEQIGVDEFVDEWLELDLFGPYRALLTDDALTATRTQRRSNSVLGLANSLRSTGTGSMPPLWQSLESFRSPLLAIAGALDTRYVEIAEQMAQGVPSGELHVVADAGHVVHVENCDEVGTRIAKFLEVCESHGDLHS